MACTLHLALKIARAVVCRVGLDDKDGVVPRDPRRYQGSPSPEEGHIRPCLQVALVAGNAQQAQTEKSQDGAASCRAGLATQCVQPQISISTFAGDADMLNNS